ncbi:integrase [Bradyrhizobium sp. AZCC 2262]
MDPPKVERSTMTTYDLKQTGQLIEAMRSTRLFAPGCPYWGCGGVRSLASGAHPKVASERLGHSRIGITLDLYGHVMPGMQEDAAARVGAGLSGRKNHRQVNGSKSPLEVLLSY